MAESENRLKLLGDATQKAVRIGVLEEDAKQARAIVHGMCLEFAQTLHAFCTDGTVPESQLYLTRLTIGFASIADLLGAGIGSSAHDMRSLEKSIERAAMVIRSRARGVFNQRQRPPAPADAPKEP